jgi:hypothetical protein
MVQNGDIGVEDFKGCRWSVKVGNSVVMVVSMWSWWVLIRFLCVVGKKG